MSGDAREPRVEIVVAVAENGVIGRDNDLPWRLSSDLRHFKALTTGHPIVMGRRTWESIGRPLPERRNVVLSRGWADPPPGVEVYRSLPEALRTLAAEERVFVIGGAALFREALALAERVHLTRVHGRPAGDVRFPDLDPAVWHRVAGERHAADERNEFDHTFEVWERRP